jgi:hypothetical protein
MGKRNKKVAIKPRLRRRMGAHLDMKLVASFANRSDLLEAGGRPDERTSTILCSHARARPHPRHSMPRLALPAPLVGHAGPQCYLSLCLARIGARDRVAQKPFCYASSRQRLIGRRPSALPARWLYTTHSSPIVQFTSLGCGRWLPRFWSGVLLRRWRVAGVSRRHDAWPRHA